MEPRGPAAVDVAEWQPVTAADRGPIPRNVAAWTINYKKPISKLGGPEFREFRGECEDPVAPIVHAVASLSRKQDLGKHITKLPSSLRFRMCVTDPCPMCQSIITERQMSDPDWSVAKSLAPLKVNGFRPWLPAEVCFRI